MCCDEASMLSPLTFCRPLQVCDWCDCGGDACRTEEGKVVVDWTLVNLFGARIIRGLERFIANFPPSSSNETQ